MVVQLGMSRSVTAMWSRLQSVGLVLHIFWYYAGFYIFPYMSRKRVFEELLFETCRFIQHSRSLKTGSNEGGMKLGLGCYNSNMESVGAQRFFHKFCNTRQMWNFCERYYYFDTHGRDSVIPLLIFNTDILHSPPYQSSIGVKFGENWIKLHCVCFSDWQEVGCSWASDHKLFLRSQFVHLEMRICR